MKEGMRIVEKVCRSDGLWCWLCTDGQGEWVTYIGIMDSPKYTALGHYFLSEEEAREDFAERQIPPQICWSNQQDLC